MVGCFFFFFQAEDGIRDLTVTGVQTCALPISPHQDGVAAPQWSDVEPIAERAVRELLGMRAREGAALAAELAGRLGALETGARAIEQRAPERLTAELARLKQAVAELAAGVQVDEQRLAVEVALMADRVDITEELVRLRTHL